MHQTTVILILTQCHLLHLYISLGLFESNVCFEDKSNVFVQFGWRFRVSGKVFKTRRTHTLTHIPFDICILTVINMSFRKCAFACVCVCVQTWHALSYVLHSNDSEKISAKPASARTQKLYARKWVFVCVCVCVSARRKHAIRVRRPDEIKV